MQGSCTCVRKQAGSTTRAYSVSACMVTLAKRMVSLSSVNTLPCTAYSMYYCIRQLVLKYTQPYSHVATARVSSA
jgi:hypothetical protein